MPTCPNCGCFINQNLTQHLLYSNKCKKTSVKHIKEIVFPQILNVVQFQSAAPSGDNVCKKDQWKTIMVVTEMYVTNMAQINSIWWQYAQ